MTRNRLRVLSIALLFGVIFTASAGVFAQTLADKVPADAMIYVGWNGGQSLGAGYDGSHLKAVVDASDLPKFFNEFLPAAMKKIGQSDRDAREAMSLISSIGGPMWRHPSALYVGPMEFHGKDEPTVHMAVLCDAGNDADVLFNQVDALVKKAPKGPRDLAMGVTRAGTLVTFTLGSATLDTKQPLSGDAKFTAALTQAQKNAVFTAYVDGEAILRNIDTGVTAVNDPQGVENWPKIRDALGLPGLRQIICTGGFDGPNWMTQSFIGTFGARTGLLSLLDAGPLSKDALKVVPQSANRVAAGQLALGKLIQQIRQGVAGVDPNLAQQLDGGLDQVNQMLGFDLQKDLFDAFGNEWVMYSDKSIGGTGLLGLVASNQPADAAKLQQTLAKLETQINAFIAQQMHEPNVTLSFRTVERDGLTIHYLGVPFVAPSWTISNNRLYIALYPQTVASAALAGAKQGPSILDNPNYQAVQKALGSPAAAAVSYIDVPQTAGDGYSEMLVLTRAALGFGDMFGVPAPTFTLPRLDQLLPHLAPMGSASWSDATGWHMKSISTFPGAELFGGGAAIGVAYPALATSILLPSLNRARETANRVKCASNLRQVGMGILMFANENKGKYPDDLGELVKNEDMTAAVFACPTGNTGVPAVTMAHDEQVQWVKDNSDYIYLGKGMNTKDATPETIIVYEKEGSHDGDGTNVLFGDGHVEFMNRFYFQQQLEKQQADKK